VHDRGVLRFNVDRRREFRFVPASRRGRNVTLPSTSSSGGVSVMNRAGSFILAHASTLRFCNKTQKMWSSQSLANFGMFIARVEGITANLKQLVQVASSADDVVCEDRDLNMTYGIFGPTARTQTGNVHRLGGEH
jgi:hypothetical protein